MSNLISAAESRAQAVSCINDVRRDANAIEDKQAAIDYAIQGTLTTVNTAIEVVDGAGHAVTQDLAKSLAESWSFAPAEEEAVAE